MKRYRPSTKSHLLQDLMGVVSVFAFVFVVKGYEQPGASIALMIVGLMSMALYGAFLWRYRTTRQVIAVTKCGVLLAPINGAQSRLRWDEVMSATHSSPLGSKWTFQAKDRKVIIFDSGISIDSWIDISKRVCFELEQRQRPIRTSLVDRLLWLR